MCERAVACHGRRLLDLRERARGWRGGSVMLRRFMVGVSQTYPWLSHLTIEAETWEAAYERIRRQLVAGTLVLSPAGDVAIPSEAEIVDITDITESVA